MHSLPSSGSTLKRRRPRGAECQTCPLVVRNKSDKWVTPFGNCKDKLCEALEDKQLHLDFMIDVDEHEAKRQEGKRATRTKRKTVAYEEECLEFDSLVGYIWPLPLYKKLKGNPQENSHHVQTMDGRKVVVLDASHGTDLTVPGVEALRRKRKLAVTKTGELGNTDEGSSEAAVETSHKAACSMLNLRSSPVDSDGQIKLKAFKFDNGDDEDDTTLLQSIWGSVLVKAANGLHYSPSITQPLHLFPGEQFAELLAQGMWENTCCCRCLPFP